MKKIFVCSPYHGDIEANTKVAKFAAKIISCTDDLPIAPHLYFPQFLDENDPYKRILGIKLGVELLKECDCLWIVGTKITTGMEYELNAAREHHIPVWLYDEQLNRIAPDTLLLDDRLSADYRRIVTSLTLYKF